MQSCACPMTGPGDRIWDKSRPGFCQRCKLEIVIDAEILPPEPPPPPPAEASEYVPPWARPPEPDDGDPPGLPRRVIRGAAAQVHEAATVAVEGLRTIEEPAEILFGEGGRNGVRLAEARIREGQKNVEAARRFGESLIPAYEFVKKHGLVGAVSRPDLPRRTK